MRFRYIGVFLAACLMLPVGCSSDTASGTSGTPPHSSNNGERDGGFDLDAQGDALTNPDADGPDADRADADEAEGPDKDGAGSDVDEPESQCGDGIISGNEQCDDGNRRDRDGCDSQCQIEPGYQCPVPGERCEPIGCGDGIQVRGEECDDGNNISGDGCSADCRVEVGFTCPPGGGACESTVQCGDGRVSGREQCDDGNQTSGDGCDSNCQVEPGWRCQVPGEACEASRCGDGIIAGNEECDDGNNVAGDGCNELCQLEPGYKCDTPGAACEPTVCGDGVREGSEACDDGNNDMGDGCTPFCTLEPTCPAGGGECTSSCGDGIRLPNSWKECEDGNTTAGDGCSPTCTVEPGFVCNDVTQDVDELILPLVIRDFKFTHPDFESYTGPGGGPVTGIVKDTLGLDGKPVLHDTRNQVTSAATFNQWYNDIPGINMTIVETMTMDELPSRPGTFQFSSDEFFPIDGRGFGDEGRDLNNQVRNFAFTTEVRYWFVYRPGQVLEFTGDDDLWVFINKKLALDLGGLHAAVSGSVDLDAQKSALGLEDDKLYEVVVFHAERHTEASKYTLTLGNFVNVTTECHSICGDGIQTPDEACDDGAANNDGSYGGCNADCTHGPYCGDGVVEEELEQCDNGVNDDLYGEDGCAPNCRKTPFCGDGRVDSLFGEECDDGTNDGSYGTCNADCTLAPRCGDGIVQAGEECDDGNAVSGDGCSSTCQLEG